MTRVLPYFGWMLAGALLALLFLAPKPVISGDNRPARRPLPPVASSSVPVVVAGARLADILAGHINQTTVIQQSAPVSAPVTHASSPAATPAKVKLKPLAKAAPVCAPGEFSPECDSLKHERKPPQDIQIAREFGLPCKPWFSLAGNYYCD